MSGALLMPGVAGPELTPDETATFAGLQPAGFILFPRNLVTPEQTRRLTDALRSLSRSHPLIAIGPDDGGGLWPPEIAPPLPSPASLAAHADAKTTGTAGLLAGELLRMLGINLCLAPVLDLISGADATGRGRGARWGGDPQAVIDHAGQWNRWLRKRGVASCAGQFPAGGGASLARPHPVASTIGDLMRSELLPYTALGPEFDAILVAHNEFPAIDPGLPASHSSRIVRRLLRDQLGFDHHLVLAAEPAPLAGSGQAALEAHARSVIEAGCDLALLFRPDAQAARAAAAAVDSLPAPLLADARERLERIRDKLQWPHSWSLPKWERTSAEIADLTREVPASGHFFQG